MNNFLCITWAVEFFFTDNCICLKLSDQRFFELEDFRSTFLAREFLKGCKTIDQRVKKPMSLTIKRKRASSTISLV